MIRRWWKRFWCLHSYRRALLLSRAEIELGVSGWNTWECRWCGKRAQCRAYDPPVSFFE